MLHPTSFGLGKKSPGTASMMLPGGFRDEEIFLSGLQENIFRGVFFVGVSRPRGEVGKQEREISLTKRAPSSIFPSVNIKHPMF